MKIQLCVYVCVDTCVERDEEGRKRLWTRGYRFGNKVHTKILALWDQVLYFILPCHPCLNPKPELQWVAEMQYRKEHQILNHQDKYLNTVFKKTGTVDSSLSMVAQPCEWPQTSLVRFMRVEHDRQTDGAMWGFFYIIMHLCSFVDFFHYV